MTPEERELLLAVATIVFQKLGNDAQIRKVDRLASVIYKAASKDDPKRLAREALERLKANTAVVYLADYETQAKAAWQIMTIVHEKIDAELKKLEGEG